MGAKIVIPAKSAIECPNNLIPTFKRPEVLPTDSLNYTEGMTAGSLLVGFAIPKGLHWK